MSKDQKSHIDQQKREVFEQEPHVHLKRSCTLEDGILSLSSELVDSALKVFDKVEEPIAFFVPASGSGSRMFEFLYDFISTGEETEEIKLFFSNFKNLAMYQSLPVTVREKLDKLQPKYLAEYLLSEDGMNFPSMPKGLIPFHLNDGRVLNPFQEQVIQAARLSKNCREVHFTVQNGFEESVMDTIDSLPSEQLADLHFSHSNQKKETDAFCFTADQELFVEDGNPVRRPAGHGALLGNLNDLDNDLVLIKNIDNVQHLQKSEIGNRYWKVMIGVLNAFKADLRELKSDFSESGLKELNNKYQFLSEQEVEIILQQGIDSICNRPTRVCGMVKNEGKPGGGPFWVDHNGLISKQIIEKIQISDAEDQQSIVETSTHFNPVYIALSKSNVNGERLDLEEYVDHSLNLVVKKDHKGTSITYRELPGLWNGSMGDWNTIFVEVPVEVFSPVKSVVDLFSEAHRI